MVHEPDMKPSKAMIRIFLMPIGSGFLALIVRGNQVECHTRRLINDVDHFKTTSYRLLVVCVLLLGSGGILTGETTPTSPGRARGLFQMEYTRRNGASSKSLPGLCGFENGRGGFVPLSSNRLERRDRAKWNLEMGARWLSLQEPRRG